MAQEKQKKRKRKEKDKKRTLAGRKRWIGGKRNLAGTAGLDSVAGAEIKSKKNWPAARSR